MSVSPSTVRNELAELEALGLLTHPHTSAGRVPTERGYRFYADDAARAARAAPEPVPARPLAATRSEVDAALQATTEMLSQVTRLLALVSAPPLETTTVRHVEVLAAAAAGRDGRRDHLDRRRDEARSSRFDDARRSGPRELGGRVPERARRRAPARQRGSAQPPRRPGAVRSRARVPRSCSRRRFTELAAEAEQRLYVGGAAGLLDEVRADELEAYQRLLETLEKRAALLELLGEALEPRRPFVRVGDELDDPALHDVALVGAAYGLANRTLGAVSLLGPVRMDYDKAIRSVRAPRSSSPASSRRSTRTTEHALRLADGDDRSATTTSSSASRAPPSEDEIKSAFRRLARELHPDVSEAPDAEERFREVVEAYEVLSNSETARALRPLRPRRPAQRRLPADRFDFGNLSDLFSAFFGDDLFGVGGRARRARGADIAAEVEIELVEAARGVTREVPFEVAVALRALRRRAAPSPGRRSRPARPAAAPAACSRSRAACSASSCARRRARRCGGRGRRSSSSRASECNGAGRVLEERTLDVEIPAGIHDGQRIRLSRRGARRRARRPGRRRLRARARPPDERFVREGNDIFSTVDLTMTAGRARRDGRRCRRSRARTELDFEPGTQPGEVRVLRGHGHAGAPGLRARRPPRARQRRSSRGGSTDEQRRLLEEFERLRPTRRTSADEGFFEKLKSAFR